MNFLKASFIKTVGILIALIWATSFSSARDLTNITYDTDYDLFYQDQFHILYPKVRELVPLAYETVLKQWGLKDTGGLNYPLTVQIKKIESHTLQRWEAAYVQAQGDGQSLRQSLVLDIGSYMQNPQEDITLIITHEMAHVILRDNLTGPDVAPIPSWFNEGLAQSVTHEGSQRVKSDVARLRQQEYSTGHLLFCDLDGPVDEFAHGAYNGGCYPVFYLAVKRLEQLGGPQTLRRVILGLRNGTPMRDLVRSITRLDWPSFQRDLETYTNRIFDGSVPVP